MTLRNTVGRGLKKLNLWQHVQYPLNRWRQYKNRYEFYKRRETIPEIDIDDRKNVLILTLDCLRNDRISRTGYERSTTPFLDTLSGYTPAISAAPWTYSSVPSILTGQYPHNHGAVYPDDSSRNNDFSSPPHGVDDEVYTIGELLANAGYETRFETAIGTAKIPVSGRFEAASTRHDFDAKSMFRLVREWWNATSDDKFAYVHLGDLHQPLRVPEQTPFGSIPDLEGVTRWRFEETTEPEDEFREYKHARELLYDTLLRQLDQWIRDFLEALHEIDDTVIIVTSDHGDEFWEYRDLEVEYFDDPRGIAGVGHGHALVPPVIEVPILSNASAIGDSDGFASSTDIVPTVLSELGADTGLEFDGRPLQTGSGERPLLSQEIAYGPNQISVTHDGSHLISVPETETELLLSYETGEMRTDRERAAELRDHIPDTKKVGTGVTVTAETKRQLADLGYAE